MQGVTTVKKDGDRFTKHYRGNQGRINYDTELAAYEELDSTGITPQLLSFTRDSITVEDWGEPLYKYLRANPDRSLEMAKKIYNKVVEMNSLGVQHRDLHEQNIVVKGHEPRIIDFELSCTGKVLDKPYDLYGLESGIEPSLVHIDYKIVCYWDSENKTLKSLRTSLGYGVKEIIELMQSKQETVM